MKRREFITLLGGATTWSLAARAQQTAMPLIGFLHSASLTGNEANVAAFHRGLGETGCVEAQNVSTEYLWAEGNYDRLPKLAADMVTRRVAVILAGGGNAPAQAAKAATTEIPVVFISGGDPVTTGLVVSLNRPGGNVTGVNLIFSALGPKRLETLHELVPHGAVIGVLVNPNYPDADFQVRELQSAANTIKRQLLVVSARTELNIDEAFANLAQRGVGGLIVTNDPFFNSHRMRIVTLSARHSIPAIYQGREFVDAGGLASYGANIPDAYRQGGVYVGRILKGEKPKDLPVQQATKFELVLNLKTAKTLGLSISPTLLVLATEMIE